MAGSDETLRLAAEVVDKWSGPLKDMQRSLRNLSDLTRKTHRQGSKDAKEQETRVSSLRREMTSLGSQVKDVVTPSMAELGITFGGVGASIAAVIASVKGFGSTATQITSLARQSKMSREEIMQWQQVGAQIGISTGQAGESLKSFSALMDQARRHSMYAFEQWKQMPGLYEALGGEELARIPDRMTQMRIAIDRISRWTADPDMRRRALRILGLPEDLAGFTKDQLDRFFSDAKKIVDDNKDKIDWEKGLDSNRAFNNLFATLEQFKLRIGSDFVEPVEHAIQKIQELFRWINQLSHPFTHVPGTFPGGAPSYGVMPPPAGAPSVRDRLGGVVPRSGQSWSDWLGLSGDKSWSKLWEKLTAPSTPSAGKAPPKDTEESIKKGTKEGVLDALREYYVTDIDTGTLGAGGRGMGGMIGATPSFGGFRPFGGTGSRRREVPSSGGEVPATGSGTSGIPKSRRDVADIAASEWRKAGMSEAGVAGVMANIKEESNFNPTLRHPDQPHFSGEAHFAHGLYQEGGTEWNNYSRWLQKNYPGKDWRDPRLQSEFTALNVKTRYPHLWERMKNARSNEEAAAAFTSEYLRPAKQYELNRIRKFYRAGVPSYLKREEYGPPAPPASDKPETFDERFKGDKSSSLLDDARRAGLMANVNGSASVDINLSGFPRGTRTRTSAEGLFKEVRLNRGAPMVLADENG